MSEKQLMIYKALKTFGPMFPRHLAKRLEYKESAWVAQELKALVKAGLIIGEGKNKTKTYKIKHENK
jgi:predicted HTH transcriptional regulator